MKIPLILGAAVTVGSLLCLPARAATWSITAATAAPERNSTTIKTTPFFGTHGAGVHFLSGMTGRAVMYLPVTVPDGTVLRSMGFRVGSLAAGSTVRAELYVQPNHQPTGKVFVLGALGVADSGEKPQFFGTEFTEHKVDNLRNSYGVRFALCKEPDLRLYPGAATDSKYATKLFSVTVMDWRCLPAMCPPPPWLAERQCPLF